MTDAVIFGNVDIIFGDHPDKALAMVDQGRTRDEISAETGWCSALPVPRLP